MTKEDINQIILYLKNDEILRKKFFNLFKKDILELKNDNRNYSLTQEEIIKNSNCISKK